DKTLPLILTGPKESADYFATIDRFIGDTLGKEAQALYDIIIDDPVKVARKMSQTMHDVKMERYQTGDAYGFNWSLKIPTDFQQPFIPTHENMANLDLHRNQSTLGLIANLRRAFSGIVAGNIKPETQDAIEEYGVLNYMGMQNSWIKSIRFYK
ncbi:hypothetical protein AAUPMC_05252, partial [Pasteurella multocida subsp. multocida str. Anand1_cattle]